MRRSILIAGLALVFAMPLSGQEAGLPADSMEIGLKYTKWFLAYEADSLWSHMTPEMRERNGGIDHLVDMMDQVALQVGTEVEVLEERYVTRNGKRQFWHTGRLSGAGINPASQAPPVDPE
jgi:hypothetical protein